MAGFFDQEARAGREIGAGERERDARREGDHDARVVRERGECGFAAHGGAENREGGGEGGGVEEGF
ncbi:hypothetical protein M7I_2036 [Glarea lozoyensis 74030]|uniref:Uncharacterized protein n=1 Tax=Glarea lozoyensis (strain ATCC 74030 / MF5533) TaxID=1104152 RepID=H0EHQ2_GLAL7|nr:hypothetical protein M7I_2036 [Glarea lozoyensis 74030]